jgi:hypothetical protein
MNLPGKPADPAVDIVVPMSDLQQHWWLAHRLFADPSLVLSSQVHVTGALDVDVLRDAVDKVVRRHEALRTVFARVAGTAAQVIYARPAEGIFAARTLRGAPDEVEAALQAMLRAEQRHVFALDSGPLIRVTAVDRGDLEWTILLTLHHIIADGWSAGLLWQELSTAYGYLSRDVPDPRPDDLVPQLREWTQRQRDYLAGPAATAEVEHWRPILADVKPLHIPYDFPDAASRSYRVGIARFAVPAELVAGLQRTGPELTASPNMITLAAFAAVLGEVTGRSDVAVITLLNHRGRQETNGLVGSIANEAVLAVRVPAGGDAAALVRLVRDGVLDAHENNGISAQRLWRELRFRPDAVGESFVFDHDVPSAGGMRFGGLHAELCRVHEQPGFERRRPSAQNLRLRLATANGDMTGVIEYNANLYARSTADAIAAAFLTRLAALVDRSPR